MRFERQPPTVHITASKGSSPGPCALCVRRENLTHKGNSVNVFTLSLYGVLSRDTNLVPWQESVDSGNWVNFREYKNSVEQYSLFRKTCFNVLKIFWLVIAVLCEKVRIFLVFSKWERWTYYSAPYVPNVQSKCFQFEELEAPFQSWILHM